MSGTDESKIVKFCTQVNYIKSYLSDDKPLLKGAWSGSHDPFSYSFDAHNHIRNG